MSTILALDQSTSATKAILFDATGQVLDQAALPHAQHYPQPGWVEHDAEEIYQNTLAVLRTVLSSAGRTCLPEHHQPARNGGRLRPRDGQAAASGDCLAVSARRSHLPALDAMPGMKRWCSERTGLKNRHLFPGLEDHLAARKRTRRRRRHP